MELLHIMEPGSYGIDFTIEHPNEREQKRKRATERLEALSSELARPGITVKMSFWEAPCRYDPRGRAKSSCHLIVMGTHGRRGLSHAFAGSVTEAVLRRGIVPVLAVRHPAFSADAQRSKGRPLDRYTYESHE